LKNVLLTVPTTIALNELSLWNVWSCNLCMFRTS